MAGKQGARNDFNPGSRKGCPVIGLRSIRSLYAQAEGRDFQNSCFDADLIIAGHVGFSVPNGELFDRVFASSRFSPAARSLDFDPMPFYKLPRKNFRFRANKGSPVIGFRGICGFDGQVSFENFQFSGNEINPVIVRDVNVSVPDSGFQDLVCAAAHICLAPYGLDFKSVPRQQTGRIAEFKFIGGKSDAVVCFFFIYENDRDFAGAELDFGFDEFRIVTGGNVVSESILNHQPPQPPRFCFARGRQI